MNIIITIVVIILQVIAAQILGFGGAMGLGVGNGWELVVFAIGDTIAVWGVGAIAAVLRKQFNQPEMTHRAIGTLVCAALGVLIILASPATGFNQILYPIIGALLGYYLTPMVISRVNQ